MKIHVPALVLSIIGLVFALILPIITYICSIAALIIANKNKTEFKATVPLILCIIGLVVAGINSILGIIMQVGGML